MEKPQKNIVDIENDSLDPVQFMVDLRDDYFHIEDGFNHLIRVIDVMLKMHNEISFKLEYNDKMLEFRKKIETDIQSYSECRKIIQTEIMNEIEHPKKIPMCIRIRILLGEI